MKVEVITRKQHSVGSSSNHFGGPDTYVAVLWSEDDSVEFPRCVNLKVLAKRGIHIRYFGEGYGAHSGPRSMYGKALAAAETFAESLKPYK